MFPRPLLHIGLLHIGSFFVPGVATSELDATSFVQTSRWRHDDSDESTRNLVAKYNASMKVMQQATDRYQGALASIHTVWCRKVREAFEQGISFTDLAERSSIAMHEALNETGTMGTLDFLHRLAEKSGYIHLMEVLGTKAPIKLGSGTDIHLQTWSFKFGTSLGFNFGHVYDEFYAPYTPVPIGKLSKLVHGEKDYSRILAVGMGISASAGITWGNHNEKQICGDAKLEFPTTDVAESSNQLTMGAAIFENQKGWSVHFGIGREYDGLQIASTSWKSLDSWVRSLVGQKEEADKTLGGAWELDFELSLASPLAVAAIDMGLCWNEGDATPDFSDRLFTEEQEDPGNIDAEVAESNPYAAVSGIPKNDMEVSESWQPPPGGNIFDKEQEDKMMTKEEVAANEAAIQKDRMLRRNAIEGSPEDVMVMMDGVREFMNKAHEFYLPKKLPIVYPETAPRPESWQSSLDRTLGLFECSGGFKKWHVKPFGTSISWCHMWGFKRD